MEWIGEHDFSTLLARALGFLAGPLGIGAWVVIVVKFLFALQSYREGLSQTVEGAKRGMAGVQRVSRLGPIPLVLALLTTVLVPVAQLLTIAMCFVGGNYVSMVFHQARWAALVISIERDPAVDVKDVHTAGSFVAVAKAVALDVGHSLRWDAIAGLYVALAAFLIVRSYRQLVNSRSMDVQGDALLLGAPATLCLGAAFCVGAVSVAMAGFYVVIYLFDRFIGDNSVTIWSPQDQHQYLVYGGPFVIGVVVCLVYLYACRAALQGSGLLARAWKAQNAHA